MTLANRTTVTVDVKLSSPDWELAAKMTVPEGPATIRVLLPMVQALTDGVVSAATQMAEKQGKKVSCTKGCGACCSQLVPIAEPEAHQIAAVVEAMPEPRRAEIRRRFAAAHEKLEAAGLMNRLLEPRQWEGEEGRALGLTYFKLDISCPFLEDQSCSIYHDRPMACREYLVTSPAEECARPSKEKVHRVPLPFQVWTAVATLEDFEPGQLMIPWVPLIVAPRWAADHADNSRPRPGVELLRALLDNVTGAKKRPGIS